MSSTYSINERANLRGRSTPSNPVMFGQPRMRKMIIAQHLVPPASPPTTYRRCFRQFDRKTDCYRKGEAWKADTLRPHKERLDLFDGCSLATVKSKGPLHRKPNTHRIAISGLETSHVRGPCGNGSISLCSDRPPFTIAVCGTQTKQGGCLYE